MEDEIFAARRSISPLGDVFSREVLEAQDGKVVPLRAGSAGPIIGEATLHYQQDSQVLEAHFRIEDQELVRFLKGSMPPYS